MLTIFTVYKEIYTSPLSSGWVLCWNNAKYTINNLLLENVGTLSAKSTIVLKLESKAKKGKTLPYFCDKEPTTWTLSMIYYLPAMQIRIKFYCEKINHRTRKTQDMARLVPKKKSLICGHEIGLAHWLYWCPKKA